MKLYMKSVKGHRYTEAPPHVVLSAAAETLENLGLHANAAMLSGMSIMAQATAASFSAGETYRSVTNLKTQGSEVVSDE